MTTCVFCGRPIEAGEEAAGRPPMAAHASCADAALADDQHWEAIADGTPEPSESPAPEPSTGGRAGGCLVLVVATLATMLGAAALRALRAANER